MPRPPQPPPEPLGECYINTLPDELLAEILSYLPPDNCLYRPPTYEQCPPIALVCKRWERNYDATLYHMVSLVQYPRWQQLRTWRIVRVLREQAELRRHVRQIHVDMIHMSQATCSQVTDLIKSCPTIHTVSLLLDRSKRSIEVWPIIHAVQKLPRLKVLWLTECDGYVSGGMHCLQQFSHPTLREVRLCCYSLAKSDATAVSYPPSQPPSQDELDELSVITRSRSSAITSMEVAIPATSPLCTMILLQWPSKLTRLSLTGLSCSFYASQYTHDKVQLILNIHRESLQHVTIGKIPDRRDEDGNWIATGIPDFSKFQCLRELQIFSHNLLAEKPSKATAKLAAPVLRHLRIKFSWACPHTEFAETQVLWMMEFASQGSIGEPTMRLQTIFVDFRPTCSSWVLRYEKAGPWPWEYVQQARKFFSQYNVAMTYSEPGCSKEEWDQMMRNHPGEPSTRREPHLVEHDIQVLEALTLLDCMP